MLSDKPEKEAPKEFLMVSFAYAVANRLLYNYRLLFSVIIMRELRRERKEGEDFHSSFGRYYDRQIHPDGSTESWRLVLNANRRWLWWIVCLFLVAGSCQLLFLFQNCVSRIDIYFLFLVLFLFLLVFIIYLFGTCLVGWAMDRIAGECQVIRQVRNWWQVIINMAGWLCWNLVRSAAATSWMPNMTPEKDRRPHPPPELSSFIRRFVNKRHRRLRSVPKWKPTAIWSLTCSNSHRYTGHDYSNYSVESRGHRQFFLPFSLGLSLTNQNNITSSSIKHFYFLLCRGVGRGRSSCVSKEESKAMSLHEIFFPKLCVPWISNQSCRARARGRSIDPFFFYPLVVPFVSAPGVELFD